MGYVRTQRAAFERRAWGKLDSQFPGRRAVRAEAEAASELAEAPSASAPPDTESSSSALSSSSVPPACDWLKLYATSLPNNLGKAELCAHILLPD